MSLSACRQLCFCSRLRVILAPFSKCRVVNCILACSQPTGDIDEDTGEMILNKMYGADAMACLFDKVVTGHRDGLVKNAKELKIFYKFRFVLSSDERQVIDQIQREVTRFTSAQLKRQGAVARPQNDAEEPQQMAIVPAEVPQRRVVGRRRNVNVQPEVVGPLCSLDGMFSGQR